MKNIETLLKVEEEGRLLVLPCKVGDTIYTVHPDSKYIHEWIVTHFSFKEELIIFAVHSDYYNKWSGGNNAFSENNLGRTAFLTREEAEIA